MNYKYSHCKIKTAVPGIWFHTFMCDVSNNYGSQVLCAVRYKSDSYMPYYDVKVDIIQVGNNTLGAPMFHDIVKKFFNSFYAFLVHKNIAICNGSENIKDYDPEYSNLFGL